MYTPVDTSNEDRQESESRGGKVKLELWFMQGTWLASCRYVITGVADQAKEEVDGKYHAREHGCYLEGDTGHDETVADIEKIVAIGSSRGDATSSGLCDD